MWRFALQNLITRPVRTVLAIVGLTIPIVAILGLFSLTHGIRSLMGNTLARMKGLIVMQQGTPAPVFSELPADLVERSAPCRGWTWWRRRSGGSRRRSRAVACSPARRRSMASGGRSPLQGFAETIMIEGEQIPEHLRMRSGAYKNGLLPASKGGGRYLNESDVGRPHVVISTKIGATSPTPTARRRRWATRSGSPTGRSRSSGSTRPAR